MPSRELQRSPLVPWQKKGNSLTSPPGGILRVLSTVLWYSLLCLGVGELVLITIHGARGANDFCEDYASAVSLLHGHTAYPPVFCNSTVSQLPGGVEYNSHPPTSIVLFLPFGLLPEIAATLLWGVISLLAYFASIWLLLRALHWPVLPGLALFAFGSIFWAPAASVTWALNIEQVLLLLLVGVWRLEERKYDSWAGVLLGVACLLKLWPLIFLVIPLLRRRWRLVAFSGVVVVAGILLALLVAGPSAFLAYAGPVRVAEDGWVALASIWNISLTGMVVGLLHGYTGTGFRTAPLLPGISAGMAVVLGEALSVALLLGGMGLLWWKRRFLQEESGHLLAFGLLVTLILVAFPLSWPWAVITLFLPAAMLLLALRRLPSPPRWWWWLLGASLLLLNIEFVPIAESMPEVPLVMLQHIWPHLPVIYQLQTAEATFPTLGVLLFAAAQALLLIRQSRCLPEASEGE